MWGGKERSVAVAMVILSFTMMLTLAFKDDMSDEANQYKLDGVSMVPKGCPDKCGNVSIYYPFGIGPNKGCYLNKWFLINCTKSSLHGVHKPYLRAFSDGKSDRVGEILGISLESQIITIQESISPLIRRSGGNSNNNSFSIIGGKTNLSATPFFYSEFYNKFMLFGCGNALLTSASPGHSKLGGCTSWCDGKTTQLEQPCNGINCCESYLGDDVKIYQANFTNLFVNASNYAFIVDQHWLAKSSPGSRQEEVVVVPVVWRWSIQYDYLHLPPSTSYTCNNLSYSSTTYWQCSCKYPKKGNPYLVNGCQDDGKLTIKQLSTIIGVSASFGFLLLFPACCILYKAIKKRKMKKMRQKFFRRNGGLLLQQQLLAKEGTIGKTKIFTTSELDKATDHFNANRILGRGGQGTVYKGMLIDGQIVAVKKSQVVDEDQVESFINEVVIVSQINHRNIVKLLGCCLETEVPILVYEFIPNGTLFSLIHDNFGDELIPLSWDIRLKIASETANALAYLHSATSIPIYHRDVKSSNILLDEKFRAKVSDFGTSRSISIDQTHLTTVVKGTFGYLDPEYFRSSQFTDKSDVYSFGVVLAELLTGQKPISFEVNDDEDRSLVTRFLLSMEENRIMEILDMEVSKQDVMAIALLANRCLNFNGKQRPTMKEVATELDAIIASHPCLPSA